MLEHGDVMIFNSLEELEAQLEAIDVRNREYECFDSEGQLISLVIETRTPQRSSWLAAICRFCGCNVEVVRAKSTVDAVPQMERLRKLLVNYLRAVEPDSPRPNMVSPIPELVAEIAKRQADNV